MSQELRLSYAVKASHGELYTGGPVAFHPTFNAILTPQNERVNAIPTSKNSIYLFPLTGEDESRVMAIAVHPISGKIAVAFQSSMIRIYEPTLKDESNFSFEKAHGTVDSFLIDAKARYSWKEIGKWKCDLVTWLSWNTTTVKNPLISVGLADGSVKVFDQIGKYCTHNFLGHSAPVMLCKFDSKSTYRLFSSSRDCTVRVWSLEDSKCLAVLKNNTSVVTDIGFIDQDSTKRKLVTIGSDSLISIYNMDSKFTLYTTIPVFESLESLLVLSPKWKYPRDENAIPRDPESTDILVAGESGILKIYNSLTAKCVYSQSDEGNYNGGIDYLFHVPESEVTPESLVISVTKEQTFIISKLETLELKDFKVGYNDDILDLAFISEDKIAVATNSTNINVFELPSFYSTSFSKDRIGHTQQIMSITVSSCKKYLASASKDQTIILWDIKTSHKVAQLYGHTNTVTCIKFFNNQTNYLISGSNDTTWRAWNIGPVIKEFEKHANTTEELGKGVFRKIEESLLTVKSHTKDINCVAISPNDRILATGSQDKEVKLFSTKDFSNRIAKPLGVLKGHKRGIWDIDFSPIDRVVCTCSADQTIRLWSLKDFSCIKTFQGHIASPLKVRYITSGLQIVSVGSDSLVKVWNVHDNECMNTFDVHTDKIWGLAIKPQSDGEFFVTGGSDSMICLWEDNTKVLKEDEQKKVDEDLLAEQNLRNYIKDCKYRKAVKLALKLKKPKLLLSTFEDIMFKQFSEFDSILSDVLENLNYDLIHTLLLYIKDWNTSSKYSLITQGILYNIFKIYETESLLSLPQVKQILQAIIPYTTRHYQRIDRIIQTSYLVDYTLQCMNSVTDLE